MKKIRFHHKEEILSAWAKDREQYVPDAVEAPMCMRCGRSLDPVLSENALSRAVDVHVCSACGTDEALRDYIGEVLPLSKWYITENGCLSDVEDNAVVLTNVCSFNHVFRGPKKSVPYTSLEYPECELAYSRSDYDGQKWWTYWFPCSEQKEDSALTAEIDRFSDLLMELPEFRTLWHMSRACKVYAESTSDPTEYNLYAETEDLYIWLRLITREKDYNLYCHFFEKAAEQ